MHCWWIPLKQQEHSSLWGRVKSQSLLAKYSVNMWENYKKLLRNAAMATFDWMAPVCGATTWTDTPILFPYFHRFKHSLLNLSSVSLTDFLENDAPNCCRDAWQPWFERGSVVISRYISVLTPPAKCMLSVECLYTQTLLLMLSWTDYIYQTEEIFIGSQPTWLVEDEPPPWFAVESFVCSCIKHFSHFFTA